MSELAVHFFKAAQGGDIEKAIDYATQAGERANVQMAYEEAAGFFERALEALDLRVTATEKQRCELLLAIGDSQRMAGNFPAVRKTFQQAAEIARRLAAPDLLSRAALGVGFPFSPFEIGVAPFPQGAFRSIVIAGTNIGMFRKASKAEQELAWKFIKWFLEPRNQMRWTEASYYLPTRRSTTRTEAYREFIFENPAYEKIILQLDFARTEPKSKEWFAGRIYLNDAIEEAMRLERSPEEALDAAAERLRLELE